MILADKIIELRKKAGLSQEELAEKINVSRQAVSKWESMQSTPDINKILSLSQIFGVSTDYLLKDDVNDAEICIADDNDTTLRKVSLSEANKFLSANTNHAFYLALGIALCIICAAPVIFVDALFPALSDLSVIPMFMLVAAGVALIVLSNKIIRPFRYLGRENIETEYGVSGMIKEKKDSFTPIHIRDTIVGIVLCIMSVTAPVIFEQIKSRSETFSEIGAALMLVIVAAGVFLIVRASATNKGYLKILEEEQYSRERKITRHEKHETHIGEVMGIYWSITTALYLGISFAFHNFDVSWIIWAIAGILCVPVIIITKIIGNRDR
ncbi:MAG: helix-turn-helix transcriptional regulator [Ruminococcus sp.]|nr:helix-turn-helix transcriptional regulator [Ruminococcus sp.]